MNSKDKGKITNQLIIPSLTVVGLGLVSLALISAFNLLAEQSIIARLSDSLYVFSLLCLGYYIVWSAVHIYKKEDSTSKRLEECRNTENLVARKSEAYIKTSYTMARFLLLPIGVAVMTAFSLDCCLTKVLEDSTIQELMANRENIISIFMNFGTLTLFGVLNPEMFGKWKEKIEQNRESIQSISLASIGTSLGISAYVLF